MIFGTEKQLTNKKIQILIFKLQWHIILLNMSPRIQKVNNKKKKNRILHFLLDDTVALQQLLKFELLS